MNVLPQINEISIAKFHDQKWDSMYSILAKKIELYDNYQDALDSCKADIVYISTVNSAHFEWAERFLRKGIHVIIDKPATLCLKETEQLLTLAEKHKKMLAEATVYLYHPQFAMIKEIFNQNNTEPMFLNLSFSFPPLDSSNFRYQSALGGGAVYDTGIYAISPGRYFFDAIPESIYCTKNSFSNDLLVSYSILAKYPDGKSMIGHFGFTTEYINHMNILGDHICVDIDRVYTIPDNIENEVKVKMKNITNSYFAPKSNMFVNFFDEVIKAIAKNDYKEFYNNMLMDSKALQMIIDKVNN